MRNIKSYLAVQVCTMLFGISALIGERVESSIATVVFGRSLFALIFLSGLNCLADKAQPSVSLRDKSKLMLNGALLAGHWFCFFMGVKQGGVAVGTLGFATFPAFVIIIESLLTGNKPAYFDIVLITMIIAGVYILAPANAGHTAILSGFLWSLMAGFSHGLVIIFNRYLPVRASAAQSSWWQCSGCLIATLPAGGLELFSSNGQDIVNIAVLGLGCTGLAYWLLISGLQVLPARTVSMMLVLEPVYALILAWLLLNQALDYQTVIGAILIVGAALLSVWLPAGKRK